MYATHPRANVLGIGISAIDMERAVALSDTLIQSGERGYVCVTGVHGIMESQADAAFRDILNGAFMTTPDGMPTVWVGHWQGYHKMSRVYGPDYMLEMCRLSVVRGYRQFLCGGKPGTAQKLASELVRRFPGLQIAGTFTPPFRRLTRVEEEELAAQVSSSKPDIFWVGLSTPKQERFMSEYVHRLDVKLMAGVGAAFDIHVGATRDSPAWVKSAGLQWLHRLCQEPRRLWKRYLINNPAFLWNLGLQLTHMKRFDLDLPTNSIVQSR